MTEAGDIIRAAFRGTLGKFKLDVAFDIPATGVTGLFGPSGCGKTSVLRAIAGLLRVPQGYFAINGDVWQDGALFRPTHKRPVGYVFQEASLFPHLSVQGNLLYGAPGRQPPRGDGLIGFDEVVALLGLARLMDRAPQNLSGGERQRVAVGRALLSQPKLLLMDEPLSALDRQTKDEILPFLERLHDSLSLPILYVSHDLSEVERLADHLVLLDAGRVQASGPLNGLQSDPTLPLAGARDASISLDAVLEHYDASYGLASMRIDGGTVIIPSPPAPRGARRRLRIAAGDVSLTLEPATSSTILNILPVRILTVLKLSENEMLAVLRLRHSQSTDRLLARVTRRSWEQLGLAEGVDVYAQIKSVALAPKAASS
jgi:molybdate transport system ATP-binding protein